MNDPMLMSFRRAARVAYSRRPTAVLYRLARHFADEGSNGAVGDASYALLLPLTLLMLALLLFGSVPSASDAIAAACSIACMP